MTATPAQLRAFAALPWEEIEMRSQASIRLTMNVDQRLLASMALAELRRQNTIQFKRDQEEDLAHHLSLCAAFTCAHAERLSRGA